MQLTIELLRTLAKTIEELDALVARLDAELERSDASYDPALKADVQRLRAEVRSLQEGEVIRNALHTPSPSQDGYRSGSRLP